MKSRSPKDLASEATRELSKWAKTALTCLSVVLVASSATSAAAKRVRQPTREDLATIWVGGFGDSVEFYRLELDGRGTGVLTVQSLPGGPASAYRVLGTTLAGYAVEFHVTPVERSEEMGIRGEATPSHLRLEVRGRDWRRRVDLQRYDELLQRIRVVAEKADAAKALPANP